MNRMDRTFFSFLLTYMASMTISFFPFWKYIGGLTATPMGAFVLEEGIEDDGEMCSSPLAVAMPFLKESSPGQQHSQTASNSGMSTRQQRTGEVPRVCLVVTTFNVADCVVLSMNSVMHQTYTNLEIIVVDDHSTDGTVAQIFQSFENEAQVYRKGKTLQLVQLTQNTNGGAGQPYNIGMESCSKEADYVMFLDGDDYMEHDAVQSMVHQAVAYDSDLVLADFAMFTAVNNNGTFHKEPSYDLEFWGDIPANETFNALTHPIIFRASPVPWRKLHKREMLIRHNLKFQEGDYYYEDNSFHWATLMHAGRCSKIDRVLFYHRQGRAGQTTFHLSANGADERKTMDAAHIAWAQQVTTVSKMRGYFPNLNAVGRGLFTAKSTGVYDRQHNQRSCRPMVAPAPIAQVYFEWLLGSDWLAMGQITDQMTDKFYRRLDQTRKYWAEKEDVAVPIGFWSSVRDLSARFEDATQRPMDLTIIMPTHNVADLLAKLLHSMYAQLDRPDFKFEVFAIDDGSTDGTQEILRSFSDQHPGNFYYLSVPVKQGAGRTRNIAIPLAEGRYTYFVDADDTYDFAALVQAVQYATKHKRDLMVMPYSLEFIKAGNVTIEDGMMDNDKQIWDTIRQQGWLQSMSRKGEALSLINYPWKQLTSTELMMNADVFFGPTAIQNDVQFHWTSIAASHKLHFYDKRICTHRLFDVGVRKQLSRGKDESRMTMFASLGMTQRSLARNGAFSGAFGEKVVFTKWRSFAENIFAWASTKIPSESRQLFENQRRKFMDMLYARSTIPEDLDEWPYWGLGERFIRSETIRS